jgi:hypothetical protein
MDDALRFDFRGEQGAGKGYNIIRQPFYGDDPRIEAKMKARERQRFAPQLDRILYGKKYVVPHYRHDDYYSQEIANRMAASSLLVPCQQYQDFDDVANAAICNILTAIKHGRPQLWLERELAEPLLRTQLPEDMEAHDIHWRWPGFRVHIPKGILRLGASEDFDAHDLMFLDICTIPAGEQLMIPEPYASEICALGKEYGWPDWQLAKKIKTTRYKQTALMISGNMNGSDEKTSVIEAGDLARGDLMVYAVVKPFDEAIQLGQIRKITNSDGDLSSPYEVTATDHQFCEKMLHLALQMLIYLGSAPLEYQPETVLRKPRLEGKHAVPGLYAARFVGASQLRPAPTAHLAGPVSPTTGRHLPQMWRAGHWKRQVHGPKRGQRKLIWIMPYQTYGPEVS